MHVNKRISISLIECWSEDTRLYQASMTRSGTLSKIPTQSSSKILIYYIGEARPNLLERSSCHGTSLTWSRLGNNELGFLGCLLQGLGALLKQDPNSILSPKILIYYIGEAIPNPLERSSFHGTSLTRSRLGNNELELSGCLLQGLGTLLI
jgi:hypothetical protein